MKKILIITLMLCTAFTFLSTNESFAIGGGDLDDCGLFGDCEGAGGDSGDLPSIPYFATSNYVATRSSMDTTLSPNIDANLFDSSDYSSEQLKNHIKHNYKLFIERGDEYLAEFCSDYGYETDYEIAWYTERYVLTYSDYSESFYLHGDYFREDEYSDGHYRYDITRTCQGYDVMNQSAPMQSGKILHWSLQYQDGLFKYDLHTYQMDIKDYLNAISFELFLAEELYETSVLDIITSGLITIVGGAVALIEPTPVGESIYIAAGTDFFSSLSSFMVANELQTTAELLAIINDSNISIETLEAPLGKYISVSYGEIIEFENHGIFSEVIDNNNTMFNISNTWYEWTFVGRVEYIDVSSDLSEFEQIFAEYVETISNCTFGCGRK